MRNILLFLFLMCGAVLRSNSQTQPSEKIPLGKIPSAGYMLGNSPQGREFWIAIPPNECQQYTSVNFLEFYVTSSKNTTVTVECPGFGSSKTLPVKAFEVTTFKDKDGGTNWAWEVRESEVITQKGIHITSPDPISVYVFSSKPYTSEGYLALPVNVLGKEYIHLSYYDYNDDCLRGGGFVVVATEDNTVINFTLKGVGYGRTVGGRILGATVTKAMKKGQTYMIRGDGAISGGFDISGTKIIANKPIGLISFQMRTIMPTSLNYSSRDPLFEMLPPISAWGKKYATIELQRTGGKGDYFRIIASQPNTKYTVKTYDKYSRELTYISTNTLKKTGDFDEYREAPAGSTLIKGASVWEADKPVLVMHYSCSSGWDGDPNFDPMMIWVVPSEQFTKGTVFQTPYQPAFVNNYFTLLAIGDPTDTTNNFNLLKSIVLDDKPVWKTDSKLLTNNIPGTNIYWAVLKMNTGSHRIKAGTPFGGDIYGYANYDAYGWPAATAINVVDVTDTLPPVRSQRDSACGDYNFTFTELRDGLESDSTNSKGRQVDQGISYIELSDTASFNYRIKLITMDPIKPDPKISIFKFQLLVIDKSKPAKAYFLVGDRAGNFTIDSCSYLPEAASITPNPVTFGNVRVGTTKTMVITLTNTTNKDILVDSLHLKIDSVFKIVSGIPSPMPFTMKIGDVVKLTVSYTPKVEGLNDTDLELDSLLAKSGCAKYGAELQGRGVMPHIKVDDWNAGIVVVSQKLCREESGNLTLKVTNPGTDTLTITKISGFLAPFSLSSPTIPPLPIKIEPKGFRLISEICYAPKTVSADKQEITFTCDAPTADDNISEWIGEGIKPGPVIDGFTWDAVRKLTTSPITGVVTLINKDRASVTVTSIKLDKNDGNFKALSATDTQGNTYDPSVWNNMNTTLDSGKSITMRFSFTPQDSSMQLLVDSISVTFADASIVLPRKGYLNGQGWKPEVDQSGYQFKCVQVGITSTEIGKVKITNPSKTAPLTVTYLDFKNANPAFEWTNGKRVVPFQIAAGDSAFFQVTFIGVNLLDAEDVIIKSDAAVGPSLNPSVTTQTKITGCAFTTDMNITNWVFPNILTLGCDPRTGIFTVSNPNKTTVRLDSFKMSGDVAQFTIISPKPTDFPITVAANDGVKDGTQEFKVLFRPTATGNYNATVEVFNSVRAGLVASITGSAHRVAADFHIVSSNIIVPAARSDRKVLPGDIITVPVTFNNPKNIESQLDNITAVIIYNPHGLKYKSATINSPAGWIIDRIQPDYPVYGKITITAHAPTKTYLSAGGSIFSLDFNVFLTNETQYDFGLQITSIGSRSDCVDITSDGGTVAVGTVCANDRRLVTSSGFDYMLSKPFPNPIQADAGISYSIGLEGEATLVLYNAMGEEVKTMAQGNHKAGEYVVKLPISELPSGMYFYRLISGSYTAIETLLIAK